MNYTNKSVTLGKEQGLTMEAKTNFAQKQRRLVTALFKEFLEILEEVKLTHDEYHGNLLEKLPPEFVNVLVVGNPLSEEKYKRLRKKVLDKGNDVLRDSESEMGNYSISFAI